MITRHQQIRRRSNGTIDIDFYREQALAERPAAKFPPDKRLVARTLIAAAMTLGPASALVVVCLAMAGMVHIVKGTPSTAVAATSIAHFDR